MLADNGGQRAGWRNGASPHASVMAISAASAAAVSGGGAAAALCIARQVVYVASQAEGRMRAAYPVLLA